MKSLYRQIPWLLGIGLFLLYLQYLSPHLWGGDAGDFASAVATRGVAHAPGYPLYTMLGILASFFPWGTLSWKIGLISVLSSAAAGVVLYQLLVLLTRTRFWSLLGVLVLSLSYPFWLYSDVVEAFALSTLFLVVLLYLLFRWRYYHRKNTLLLAAFIFGLSLSHHHTIVFLLPTLAMLLFPLPRFWTVIRKVTLGITCLLLVGCGLVPYLYVMIAATYAPGINWMGTPTGEHFLQLVTRASYGTFRSAAFIGNEPLFRFSEIFAFLTLLFRDFRLAGVILVLIGIWSVWRDRRDIFWPLITGIAAYLFFLFYAAFPLLNDFFLGVFERFVLPLYVFAAIFLTFGCMQLEQWLLSWLVRRGKKDHPMMTVARWGLFLVFLMYPLGLWYLNQGKIRQIQRDTTLETYGKNILSGVPPGSIVLEAVDTPLFSAQYAYYVLRVRSDVRLIHVAKLGAQTRTDVRRQYPNVIIPDFPENESEFFSTFLKENSSRHPVFMGSLDDIGSDHWVPWGLLFRYVSSAETMPLATVIEENDRLWRTYQDPLAGMLKNFRPFLIADLPLLYASSRQHVGAYLGTHHAWKEAVAYLREAQQLAPADSESVSLLAQVEINSGDCPAAMQAITTRDTLVTDDATHFLLLSLYAQGCSKDEAAAQWYWQHYNQALKKQQTPLRQLW